VQVGSVAEREEQQGIAHVLEHVVFLATERFRDFQELRSLLASWGMSFGGDTNAFTDFRSTAYTLTVPLASLPDPLPDACDDDGLSDGLSDSDASSDSSDFDSDDTQYSDYDATHPDPPDWGAWEAHDAFAAEAVAAAEAPTVVEAAALSSGDAAAANRAHRSRAQRSRDLTIWKALQVLYELVFNALILDADIDNERGAGMCASLSLSMCCC
jgi:predicted Zn-dependent peptidase